MSTAPVTSQDWFAANAPPQPSSGGDWFAQNAPKAAAAPESRSMLDHLANDPVTTPLDSYAHATKRGLETLGKGAAQAVQGFGNLIAHPIDSIRGMAELPSQTAALAKEFKREPPSALELSDAVGTTAGNLAAGEVVGKGISKIPAAAGATIDAGRAVAGSRVGQSVGTIAKAGAKLADVSTFERLSKGANVLKNGVQKLADIWRTPEASLDDMTDHLAQVIADDRAQRASALNKPVRSEGLAEVEQGKPAAEKLLKDATAPNDTTGKELGLIKSTGAKSAAETGEALGDIGKPPTDEPTGGKTASAPRFTMQDRMRAKELLQDSLSRGTQKVVDAVIPKRDATYGANLQTKAAVDFNLQRGDVAGAEKVIDAAAKQANPAWEPLQRTPAPTVAEIRARIQQGPGSKADSLETRGIQEQMRNDLALHGWSAEAEARREFIARNSTGMTKGELTGQQPKPVRYTKTPGVGRTAQAADSATSDLTDILQQSLDAAKKRQSRK